MKQQLTVESFLHPFYFLRQDLSVALAGLELTQICLFLLRHASPQKVSVTLSLTVEFIHYSKITLPSLVLSNSYSYLKTLSYQAPGLHLLSLSCVPPAPHLPYDV